MRGSALRGSARTGSALRGSARTGSALTALLLAFAGCLAPVQAQVSVLRGVDLYRSRSIFTSTLKGEHAALLDSLAQAVTREDMDALGEHMGALARVVRDAAHPAFLDLSPIQYPHGDTTVWYITVDVVDSLDAPRRLDFLPAPTGQVEGLDSLLATWRAFEAEGWDRRAFHAPGDPCPALHCVFSFADPELAPYEALLREGALAHADELERMLAVDADAQDRATAAFVLAHLPDEERVAGVLLDRVRDPSSLVRNNVMRVLAFMARNLRSDAIPVGPFLDLIDGPTTTDRNKALAVLDGLVEDPATHALTKRRAGPHLIDLLALEQPNNHDFAYSILKKLSGLDFGPRAYDAWGRWLMRSMEVDNGR